MLCLIRYNVSSESMLDQGVGSDTGIDQNFCHEVLDQTQCKLRHGVRSDAMLDQTQG